MSRNSYEKLTKAPSSAPNLKPELSSGTLEQTPYYQRRSIYKPALVNKKKNTNNGSKKRVHNFSKSVCLRIRLETQQAWLNRQ
jgi:hypothetical protein